MKRNKWNSRTLWVTLLTLFTLPLAILADILQRHHFLKLAVELDLFKNNNFRLDDLISIIPLTTISGAVLAAVGAFIAGNKARDAVYNSKDHNNEPKEEEETFTPPPPEGK